jgi:hypothetical protein
MHKPVLIIGFLCMAFGWWGSNTAAGRRRFEGKNGIIPIAALVIGTLVFAAGLFLFVRR